MWPKWLDSTYSRVTALATVLGLSIGAASGVGGYTFIYAKGSSYLTNDPAACANCHVMQSHYDAWLKSSHYAVATCNDCHTPHSLVPKYWTKALNGYYHSLAFTTGEFHEPIQATYRNKVIAEESCRDCHADLVDTMNPGHFRESGFSCTRCHDGVGHDL